MTRDEAVGRAIAWLTCAGFRIDELVLVREVFIPAEDTFACRDHDEWVIFFEPLFPDPDFHPNTLGIRVDPATGHVENIGLM